MPKVRFPEPEHLPGATRFSRQPEVNDPFLVIAIAKEIGAWEPLVDATRRIRKGTRGPHPEFPEGWAAAKLTQVLSGEQAVGTWFDSAYAQQQWVWRKFGMPRRPSQSEVYACFNELWALEPMFAAALGKVVQFCAAADPRITMYWHVDGREAEAHIQPEEVAEEDLDDFDILDLREAEAAGVKPTRLRKLSTQEVKAIRSAAADKVVLDDAGNLPGTTIPKWGEWWEVVGGDVDIVQVKRDIKGRTRVKIGASWFWTRDPQARLRIYQAPDGRITRIWIGYYHMAVIDHFTGATISVAVRSAGVQEALIYPEAMHRARDVAGRWPRGAAGDKGLYTRDVFMFNADAGIGTAIPPRANSAKVDTVSFDSSLVAHCEHCGAPARFVRWRNRSEKEGPALIVMCAKPTTDRCRTHEQYHPVREDPLRRQRLWMTHPTWHALNAGQHNSEHAHDDRAARYGSGGNDRTSRLFQLGVPAQQLHATVACLVDWLRVAWRLDLLPAEAMTRLRAQFKLKPKKWKREIATYRDKVKERMAKLHTVRAERGLNGHWGPGAVAEGLGPAKPPSVLAREARKQAKAERDAAKTATEAADTAVDDPDPPPDDDVGVTLEP